ncbi:MAG: hypothetical protein ABI651_04860 [Verrucomicrobiota bacterium]
MKRIEWDVDSQRTFLEEEKFDVADSIRKDIFAYIELVAQLIRGRPNLACEFIDSINRKKIAFLPQADNTAQVVSAPNAYTTILKKLDTRSFMVVLNEYDRLAEEVQETLRPAVRKILEEKVRGDYEDYKMGHFGVMRFLTARRSLVESILGRNVVEELLPLPVIRVKDEDEDC